MRMFDLNDANVNAATAPDPGLLLFESEEDSDLVFIVTRDTSRDTEEQWRFPGHSFVLENCSPVFGQIVRQVRANSYLQMMDGKPVINIQSQPNIFHMLMSWVYKQEVHITNVSNCCDLLEVSVKFMLFPLAQRCLAFLQENVDPGNVLQIIVCLATINGLRDSDDYPNYNHLSYDNQFNELASVAYKLLDKNGDTILRTDYLTSLDSSQLIQILSRDTLQVSDELVVFDALHRWSVVKCSKDRKELIGYNKRALLGDAIYCVRYLTMSDEQFMSSPMGSDILIDEEKKILSAKLKDSSLPLPPHMEGWKIDQPRKPINDENGAGGNSNSILSNNNEKMVVSTKKRSSPFKKILNGFGDVMIFVIQLLD